MKRWQMIKLGLILAVYTIVGCVGLAFVYNSTSKTIAQRKQADLQAGLQEVFPAATGFTPTDKITSSNPKIVFDGAYTADGPSGSLGVAVQVHGPSYGGDTTLIVGVSTNGTITGKKVTDAFVVKQDVIAITSATITSRSITNLVQAVAKAASDALGIAGSSPVSSSQSPSAVLPSADTIQPSSRVAVSSVPGVSILETSVGTKSGTIVGASAKAKAKCYDGDATVLVGVSTDGTITGVQILECTDSLGSPILAPEFAQQFVVKKADAPLEIGTNIEAVSGATFSSRGATALVKATADALVKVLAGGGL